MKTFLNHLKSAGIATLLVMSLATSCKTVEYSECGTYGYSYSVLQNDTDENIEIRFYNLRKTRVGNSFEMLGPKERLKLEYDITACDSVAVLFNTSDRMAVLYTRDLPDLSHFCQFDLQKNNPNVTLTINAELYSISK